MNKRKSSEFYTITDENGNITVHDYVAEIAAKHAPPPVSADQLEAWKRTPKEQALKEALELFRAQGIDVTEARFKLDVLRFISDLQGAQAPQATGGQVIQIIIGNPGIPPKRIVEVENKKEDAP